MIDVISVDTKGVEIQTCDCQGVEFNVESGKIICIQYEENGAIYIEYTRNNPRSIMVLEPVSRGQFTLKVVEE